MTENYFNELNAIDVNDKTESKNGLTYLSWAWAWAEVKKLFPYANYEIKKFENNLPYVYDPLTGYMVFTEVTIEDVTHEMWLPVMDSANKAMKAEPYTYEVGFGEKKKTKKVEAADMFDINKTIMRCLTKNLAMHGLGLYIYAGEDLPEVAQEELEKLAAEEAKMKEEIKECVEKVVKEGSALIKKGITKDKVSETVAMFNDGDGNPKTIKNKEACDNILKEFKKLKEDK